MSHDRLTRRAFLQAGSAAVVLAACSADPSPSAKSPASASTVPAQTEAPSRSAPSASAEKSPAAAPSAAPPGTNSAGDIINGPRTVPAVALTFHGAGDLSITRDVLATLASAQVSVTVFAVGTWLEQHPDIARTVLDAGHDLGNHTYQHLTMPRLDATTAASEVSRCADVLTRQTGRPTRWFRPSGTPSSTPTIRAAASAAGYPTCVSYDVDSLDYTDPGPAAVRRNVLAAVQPGSIVSLHLGHAGTVTALGPLLTDLHDHGLAPVTLSRLLS